jgi:hypothetical protein
MPRLKEYHGGDTMGLLYGENYLVTRWQGPGKILFSLTRRGKGMEVHLTSDRAGLRHLHNAVDDCIFYIFSEFPWCRMILANIKKRSIEKLLIKHGFKFLFKANDGIRVHGLWR